MLVAWTRASSRTSPQSTDEAATSRRRCRPDCGGAHPACAGRRSRSLRRLLHTPGAGPRTASVTAGAGRDRPALRLSKRAPVQPGWRAPGPPAGPPSDIRPGIRHLVNRLEDAAVTVLDATYQLAWNELATALLGDFSANGTTRPQSVPAPVPDAGPERAAPPDFAPRGVRPARGRPSALQGRATRMILKSRRSSPKRWPAAPSSRKSGPPTMSRCSAG